jgi:hypothetical protein
MFAQTDGAYVILFTSGAGAFVLALTLDLVVAAAPAKSLSSV